MAMTLIRKTNDYRIFKRGDGRFAVQDGAGKPVNGEDKVKILLAEDLIKVTLPAEPEPEAPAEEATETTAEADADEAPTEGEDAAEAEDVADKAAEA